METVTFTCTAPGSSLRWQPSDVDRITIRNTAELNVLFMLATHPGYTITLTGSNATSLTSALSRVAVDGITVSCIATTPTLTTIGSTTIHLAGELLFS